MSEEKSLTLAAEQVQLETTRAAEAFKAGPLFRDDPTVVDDAIAVSAWVVIDALDKMLKERKESYRQRLFKTAVDSGGKTSKGGDTVSIDRNTVTREHRPAKTPDESALRTLLESKGVALTESFDEVKTLQFNASKFQYLVDRGIITKKEFEALHKVSYVLKVAPSPVIKDLLSKFMDSVLGKSLSIEDSSE